MRATTRCSSPERPGRARILASNSKLFTTATALGAVRAAGPAADHRLVDRRRSRDGVSQGLYLRGGGDPTLSGSGPRQARRPRARGRGDDGAGAAPLRRLLPRHVDRHPRARHHAPRASARLSGLRSTAARPGDPAKSAAQRFQDALRKDGVSIGNSVTPGGRPAGRGAGRRLRLPDHGRHVQDTNVPSNNFFAEMLLKDLGRPVRRRGLHRRPASRSCRSFAAEPGREIQRRERLRA